MILSKSFLREQAKSGSTFEFSSEKERIFTENMELAKKYDTSKGKYIDEYDIFLSHSSLDQQLVLELVKLFNNAGYSVYVDWIEDKQLDRSCVTKETADLLRVRMENSKGLAYVSTSNTTTSKWCPWELGYFDGKKKSRCCILPIMEGTTFKGQEYLGLYPYIEYEKAQETGKYDFWICDQDSNKYIILRKWLTGSNPYVHK